MVEVSNDAIGRFIPENREIFLGDSDSSNDSNSNESDVNFQTNQSDIDESETISSDSGVNDSGNRVRLG